MTILNYKKLGQGEPIIILHGLYGSGDNWLSIARLLMNDFSVYLLDLRNHGASPHLDEHNYDVMVDDLVYFMNEKQIYSTILLGHSMGGKVAMFFAAAYPERVRKLIIVDISPRTYDPLRGDFQFKEHETILNALIDLKLDDLDGREAAEVYLENKIGSGKISQFLLKNLKRSKNKQFAWKINLPILFKNLSDILQGLEEVEDDLRLYKNPVLFIKGNNSSYIKENDIKLIKKLFAAPYLKVIEDAGHWVHAEKQEEFVKELTEFVLS